jgi:hypothetical protein
VAQQKRRKRSDAVTFETVRELASRFPGVEDGTSYGTVALRVKSKFMARLREDGDSVAFRVSFDEREILMRAKPGIFFVTDHYRPYPAVLLRLSAASRHEVADIVELSWRFVAPKRLIAEFDSELHRR